MTGPGHETDLDLTGMELGKEVVVVDLRQVVDGLKWGSFRSVSSVHEFETVRTMENEGDQIVTIRIHDTPEAARVDTQQRRKRR